LRHSGDSDYCRGQIPAARLAIVMWHSFMVEKNFSLCPHCFAKGRQRQIRPATPHRTPLVSRSDGSSFHLFVEDSYVRPAPQRAGFEVLALFRYDLDPAEVKAESTLVVIPTQEREHSSELLEQAADQLAGMLAGGADLVRVYVFDAGGSRLLPIKHEVQLAR